MRLYNISGNAKYLGVYFKFLGNYIIFQEMQNILGDYLIFRKLYNFSGNAKYFRRLFNF